MTRGRLFASAIQYRPWLHGLPLFLTLLFVVLGPLEQARAFDDGGETITLAEYQQRVEELITSLSKEGAGEVELEAAQAQLDRIAEITLPSGELVHPQNLLERAERADTALARLQLVQDQLALSANDNTATRLAVLDQVFERTEFGGETLFGRFQRWLRDLLDRLFPDISGASESNPAVEAVASGLSWVIAIGAGLAIVLLLSYWLQGILGNFVADAELRRRQAAGENVPLTAAAARGQATEQAQVGNYREAVRNLYLSALLGLEERGLVQRDRSLTNRELLAQTSARTDVHQTLEPVVETFDEVWYGVQEPDQSMYQRYEHDVNTLSKQAFEKTEEGGE